MKWYKHLAKSIDNPFVRQLMYEFGSDAYLIFFGTLEIYADNFSSESDWKLIINLRYFHEKFLLSKSKIKNVLSKITEWEVNFNNDDVVIFIPKFKELLDNYTKDTNPKNKNKLASDLQETFQPIRIKNKDNRRKIKEDKSKYLDSVFLSDVQYKKLQEKIGQKFLDIGIKQLDYSISVKGNKYKDHYKTILNWHERGFLKENDNGTGKTTSETNTYRKNYNDRELPADVAAEADKINAEYYRKKAAIANSQDDKKAQ